MKRLFFLLILIIIVGNTSWSQDFFIIGNPATCNGSCDGYIEFEITSVNGNQNLNLIPPYAYNWSIGVSNEDIYNLCAGTYYLTLTDAVGGTAVIAGIVNEPDPLIVTELITNSTCQLCCDGMIDLTVTGGNPPYSYLWSMGATFEDLINFPAGEYVYWVFDSNGCLEEAITYILPNPLDTQRIFLPTCWDMFSTYKDVNTQSLDTFLSSIEGNFLILKNWEGKVYIPQYGVNQFDTVRYEYGFQIRMINSDTLYVTGQTLIPQEFGINLPAGWSMIGYPRCVSEYVTSLMSSIANHIIILKNQNGSVYWPQNGVLQFSNLLPGQAYQIKLDIPLMFYYPGY